MLHPQMQIKAAKTKRQTAAYHLITSQPLQILWQCYQSHILTAIHKKSASRVTRSSADSSGVRRFESSERFLADGAASSSSVLRSSPSMMV